jgi:hypothetical protein
VDPFPDIVDTMKAQELFIRENWARLPDRLKEEIIRHDGPGVSPVMRTARITEGLYAFHRRAGTGINTRAGRELIGRSAAFLRSQGLHDFGGERGRAIVAAMRRETGEEPGEGQVHQDREADPAPLEDFELQAPDPASLPKPSAPVSDFVEVEA